MNWVLLYPLNYNSDEKTMAVRLIIDGDVQCHSACRYSDWISLVKKIEGEFKEVRQYDSEGAFIPPKHTRPEERKYMEDSWKNFKKDLDGILKKFFTNDFKMAVKGEGNFRDDMYPDYKQNRKNQEAVLKAKGETRRKYVNGVRDLAIMEGLAVPADGMEADDYVRIWAEEARQEGQDFIIVTIDKDLKCIPGRHYNPSKKELITMSEADSLRFFYQQLLSGDPTDNIPGIPGIAEKTATKELMHCMSEEEFQENVVGNYIAAYQEEWYAALTFNGALLYILKSADDKFTIDHWPIVKELTS